MHEITTSVWRTCEIDLTVHEPVTQPYVAVSIEAVFTHDTGEQIRRPAFWNGGQNWRVRFASPRRAGHWRWTLRVEGVASKQVTPAEGVVHLRAEEPRGLFERHGLLRMSNDRRSVIHADGRSFLVVADTPWALPFRATAKEAAVYAADRAGKGFNAALLMTIQPDMFAQGPRDRRQWGGFDVGFEDLPEGTLRQLNPDYFQTLDTLVEVLRAEQIVPVFQPVFHGFGWKGKTAGGRRVSPEDYARYCRYLVARYGAGPAIWLVGGDGSGHEPNIAAGGRAVHACDAYAQPTGIHYGPHFKPNAHQAAPWLDFQWCQTGHAGEHLPERVMWLYMQQPAKAVANGEPSYEMPDVAGGWWQGHEAWSNLCSGGTMGVVYGSMSLWMWRLDANEPGHAPNFIIPDMGWREAMAQSGSTYVGNVGRILRKYNTAGLEPDWTCTYGHRGLIRESELYVLYLPDGGQVNFFRQYVPATYHVYDAKSAKIVDSGDTAALPSSMLETPGGPHVVVFTAKARESITIS